MDRLRSNLDNLVSNAIGKPPLVVSHVTRRLVPESQGRLETVIHRRGGGRNDRFYLYDANGRVTLLKDQVFDKRRLIPLVVTRTSLLNMFFDNLSRSINRHINNLPFFNS